MALTYEPIATTTLSSDQATITFSTISGNYTDLVLVFNGNSTNTGSDTNGLRGRVNGDTGTNYSGTILRGNGTSASGSRYTSTGFFEPTDIAQTSNTNPTIAIIHFMNYSNTTTYKTFISRGTNPTKLVDIFATLWRSTSAITSIEISRDFGSNNLKSGCTATLYGIKAA